MIDTEAAGRIFEAEMQAKQAAPVRPAGTRRSADLDTLSGIGATRLSRIICDFWRTAGFEIEVEIVPVRGAGSDPSYGIRSNMIGGLPRQNNQQGKHK